ncbi:hypothetical protein HK101_005847, partial [Irineochytrium annulatum]
VHFGKFASYYLRGEYYFDVHPPLGKLALAAVGWLLGYDGHFLFEDIGLDYVKNNVPYVGMRMLPALCGAMVVPLAFGILKQMGCEVWTAVLCSIMLTFDISLITQSRLILLDSMLMFLGVFTVYNWVRFYKERHNPFTFNWWYWLTLTGVGLGCTCGVKMVGLFAVATVGVAVLVDLWRLLDKRRGVPNWTFAAHFGARALCLIALPIALYLSFFYIHFELLQTSGPGDAFMSPAFRAELRGSDVLSKSVAIPYKSKIALKHRESQVYLHSHADRYPMTYTDGRVSSQGQQVTGYPHRDPNNEWQLMAAEAADPSMQELKRDGSKVRYLRQHDVVRLWHEPTRSYLRTHDVASPLTRTNTEVTTITKEGIMADGGRYSKAFNDTMFKVEVLDLYPGDKIRSVRHHFRLRSVSVGVNINIDKQAVLPPWGFGQAEVNGERNPHPTTVWFIDDVKHSRIVNGKEIDDDVTSSGAAKHPPRTLSFLSKFIELHNLMIHHNAGLTTSHPYSSRPHTWPLVLRGISFWETRPTLQQIYLLGNPLVWWSAIAGCGAFVLT